MGIRTLPEKFRLDAAATSVARGATAGPALGRADETIGGGDAALGASAEGNTATEVRGIALGG